jgi:hypothetical protein
MKNQVPEHENLTSAVAWCHRAKVTLTFTGRHTVAYFTKRPLVRVVSKDATKAIQKLRTLPLSAFTQPSN